MKKLYRKGTVHPSPPPPPPPIMSEDHLSILPAAIFALAAALSPGDREVLAYLLLCCNNNSSSSAKKPSPSSSALPPGSGSGGGDHSPRFGCDCFRCYTTYWVRWGSSPNRQLIHDIIEAFEDHQHNHSRQSKAKGKNGKRERRNNSKNRGGAKAESKRSEFGTLTAGGESSADLNTADQGGGERGEGREVVEETSTEKGSNVRRFVNFVGERIWGVWG